ncbi:MAG: hypothetical protein EA401_06820 [Planctomycetota bacterium]|nr:MAG: hypothetical protein EA401_06820 [Planctomycetota bacterium]
MPESDELRFDEDEAPLDTDSQPTSQQRVVEERRVEAARSTQEIDDQLASMTQRTSLEELAKRGKTKNLKTLSERNLKRWIQEALRRVISSSTTIDSEEADRLLANTRQELSSIMSERQAEANNRAADAQKISELAGQLQASQRRCSELEQSLEDSHIENNHLQEQIADLDADLASKELSGGSEAMQALRQELAAAKEKAANVSQEHNQLRRNLGRQLVASAEVVTALFAIDQRFYNGRHQPKDVDDDGENMGAEHQEDRFFADQRAAAEIAEHLGSDLGSMHEQLVELVPVVSEGAEGALAADRERLEAMIWIRVHEDLMDDMQQQIEDLQQQLAHAHLSGGAPAATQHSGHELAELQAELADLRAANRDVEQQLLQSHRTITEHETTIGNLQERLQRSPDDAEAMQVDQRALQEALTERDRAREDVQISKGTIASLRRQIAQYRKDLDLALAAAGSQNDDRIEQLTQERDALRADMQKVKQEKYSLEAERDEAAAEQRTEKQRIIELEAQISRAPAAATVDREPEIQQLQQRIEQLQRQIATTRPHTAPHTAPHQDPSSGQEAPDTDALHEKLQRITAVITAGDGAPYEDIAGTLAPRKPGMWFSAWRDGKNRLKAARTVGDRWVKIGRNKDFPHPQDLATDPLIISRGDHGWIAWNTQAGCGFYAPLDKNGRIDGPTHDVGPVLGTPVISRASGNTPLFLVLTDPNGEVFLRSLDDDATEVMNMHRHLGHPPAAVGPACAWHWALENSRHIAWRDHQGSIHELLELHGIWYHAPLSERLQAPPAVSDPVGYAPADHEHILYLGQDGHIHEFIYEGQQWRHHDLTLAAGNAPAASAPPNGGYVLGRHYVVYRGVDGYAHCLCLRRDWRYYSLEQLGPVSEVSFTACGDQGAISFVDRHGQHLWARFVQPQELSVEPLPMQ